MAEHSHRRGFLNAALAGAAGVGASLSLEERILGSAMEDGSGGLASGIAPYDGEPMPRGTLKGRPISRLVMGGNLIGGWAHSRDLLYVSNLLRAYNTEAKVFETLALAEASGISMIQISPSSMDVVCKYRDEQGGRIDVMVCVHPHEDEAVIRDEIRGLVDRGACALYTHGEVSDRCTMRGDLGPLARAVELIKAEGLPAGVGSHALETTIASEERGIDPDFYVKTLHPDTYWSATPEEARDPWCWYRPRSPDRDGYHDNMFCLDPERTVAFMETVQKPWFAFKVMAAGAVPAKVGFTFAFERGADFIIAGMFDFQVVDDVGIAVRSIRRSAGRGRGWMA
jgi:hypothetical protein